MSEKEVEEKVIAFGKTTIVLPKCRLEMKWIYDIFLFLLFLLIMMIIPYGEEIFFELIIFIFLGFLGSLAFPKGFNRKWLIIISAVIVTILYMPRISLYLPDILPNTFIFITYFIILTTYFLLGNMMGSIIRSILNYKLCKRGEL